MVSDEATLVLLLNIKIKYELWGQRMNWQADNWTIAKNLDKKT